MPKASLTNMIEKSLKSNWSLPAFSNYNGKTLTYGEVADRIVQLHYFFKKLGIKKGEKIAILGKNSVDWAIVYLATVTYGAVIVPILPDFKPGDVHHIVNHSDSLLLYCSEQLFENLDARKMPEIYAVISLEENQILTSHKKVTDQILAKTSSSYLDWFEGELKPESLKFPEINVTDLAALVYTSGTTGFSKGVMLPHKSLISNILFARKNMPLEPGNTIVSFLPIAHVFGCTFEFLFPFCSGCHITFLSKIPSPKVIIAAFQKIHPNLILSVPLVIEKIYRKQIKPVLDKPVMKLLIKLPLLRSRIQTKIRNKLNQVFGDEFREIVIGGAPLNDEVELFLRSIKFRYTVGYGMTECGPLISYAGWKDFRKSSAGKLVDDMEIRIDSDDPKNQVGEIVVRGENVMTGYYKNKEATEAALDKDGWFKTGDLGVIDDDNFIYIKGRSKSMILGSSGQNIYPEEIESKLSNLPYVQECIVIDRKGKITALVYPDMEAVDSLEIGENKLLDIMEDNRNKINQTLPGYMKIAGIEVMPEEFEKTPKRSIKRFLYHS